MSASDQQNSFQYWQAKQVFASDDQLLKCMKEARECIEKINIALSHTDEAYPRVHLEPRSE